MKSDNAIPLEQEMLNFLRNIYFLVRSTFQPAHAPALVPARVRTSRPRPYRSGPER